MIHHLEHHQADRNCFRFYRLEVEPDLFGDWSLRCSWGRIGTYGRDRLIRFETKELAEAERSRMIRQKQRKGYVLLPVQLCLAFEWPDP